MNTTGTRPPPPVRACLFDMDGLLIDSEDLYTAVTNTVLEKYGRPPLPWNIKAQLQGRPSPEATAILLEWAKLPVEQAVWDADVAALQLEYFTRTQALPGVGTLLKQLKASGLEIALATSSTKRNYMLKTAHLQGLFAYFQETNRVLGDDSRIPKGRGKPAPDIYLLALKTINDRLRQESGNVPKITPDECLVFEDSVPGVEAGRRAGMQTVWCPHPGLLQQYRGREEEVLAGLTGEHKEPAVKAAPITEATGASQLVAGTPGKLQDGWAVLLETLEDFPYDRFGIAIA